MNQLATVSRFSPEWRPGFGSAPERVLSTAEVYAKLYGIPIPAWVGKRHWSEVLPGRRGTGDVSPQQINAVVTTGASQTVGILAALGAIPGPGWVAAAIGGLIAVGSMIANMFRGCGQTCIIASEDADKFEAPLKQNLQQYLSAPVHYRSLQQAALNNVDTLFAALRQACSDPSLQDAGRRCISERLDASACHWKASPGGWQGATYTPYGAAGSGDVCWNWVIGYRNPIASDPNVVDDPSAFGTDSGSGTTSLTASGQPTNYLPLVLVAGLIVLAVSL